MTINDIVQVLPHRYPFLMVDKIEEISIEEKRVVGIKNVTINEPFFQGHFPGFPIMPGVLIVEAMAQTGGLLLQEELKEKQNALAVFMGIREAKFRKPVVPGDILRIEVTLSGRKFNTCTLSGKATVEGALVAQAEITIAIVERN